MTMKGFMQLAEPRYIRPKTPVSVRVCNMPPEGRARSTINMRDAANQKKIELANGRAITAWHKLPNVFSLDDVKKAGISGKSAGNVVRRLISLEYVVQLTYDRCGAKFKKVAL